MNACKHSGKQASTPTMYLHCLSHLRTSKSQNTRISLSLSLSLFLSLSLSLECFVYLDFIDMLGMLANTLITKRLHGHRRTSVVVKPVKLPRHDHRCEVAVLTHAIHEWDADEDKCTPNMARQRNNHMNKRRLTKWCSSHEHHCHMTWEHILTAQRHRL